MFYELRAAGFTVTEAANLVTSYFLQKEKTFSDDPRRRIAKAIRQLEKDGDIKFTY